MDPLKYLFKKTTLAERIAKWQLLLVEFDIVGITQMAIKGQEIADHKANNPIEDYQPMKSVFSDESILVIESEEDIKLEIVL